MWSSNDEMEVAEEPQGVVHHSKSNVLEDAADSGCSLPVLCNQPDISILANPHSLRQPHAPETGKRRVTTPYMTKFERARVLGTRALQVSMNAPVLINVGGESDPLRIGETN